MKTNRIGKLALGGVFSALAVVFLLLTLTPVATVGTAALAALCGIPVVMELGRKVGWLHFAAVAVLSLLIIPAWEGKLMYVCFFGWYTVGKAWLEQRSLPRWGEYLIKIVAFWAALAVWGVLCYHLLSPALPRWFGWWMLPVAGGVLTAVFLVYDRCLSGLATVYWHRFHPMVRRLFRF